MHHTIWFTNEKCFSDNPASGQTMEEEVCLENGKFFITYNNYNKIPKKSVTFRMRKIIIRNRIVQKPPVMPVPNLDDWY